MTPEEAWIWELIAPIVIPALLFLFILLVLLILGDLLEELFERRGR
jgi:ABC-type polysaccharide transport system permease subunit